MLSVWDVNCQLADVFKISIAVPSSVGENVNVHECGVISITVNKNVLKLKILENVSLLTRKDV